MEQLLRNNSLDEAFNIIKKFFRGKKKLNSRLRDIDGNLILDNDKIATRWKQHVEALYQEGEAASLNNNNNSGIQGEVILRDEFNRTLKLMKTGKAAGTDDIGMELIQNESTELQDELFILVNDVYTTGEISKDFTESIIIHIPKKATADKCNEFRTISLMAHTAKILVKIICTRIESTVEKELSDDQFGFRRNKGTREAILSLRILIEKQIEFNKDTFITFIELEKAFDNVPWKGLFYTLEGIGTDFKDRRII